MPWSDAPRRQLPGNWRSIKRKRHELDNWTCVDCGHRDRTGATLECDHIGAPDDHRIHMLRTRCSLAANGCHARRTQAKAATHRRAKYQRNRPEPRHPGLLD